MKLLFLVFVFVQPLSATELINKMITDPNDTTSLNINFDRMGNAVRSLEYKFKSSESCRLDIPKYAGIFCYDNTINRMYVATGTSSGQFAILMVSTGNYIDNTNSLQNGSVFYVSSGSSQGTLTSYGGFVGPGSSLTSLNASNISAGTLNSLRLDTSSITMVGPTIDLTSEITGILPTANGGTGSTSETDPKVQSSSQYKVPYWNGSALFDGLIYDNGIVGRVGIGITNPNGLFQVGGGSLTVMMNGNVGIGSNNPQTQLDVIGTIKSDGFSVPRITTGNYDGDNTVNKTIAHGLGKTPKLVLFYTAAGGFMAIIRPGYTEYTDQSVSYSYSVSTWTTSNFYVGNADSYVYSLNVTGYTYYWVAFGD